MSKVSLSVTALKTTSFVGGPRFRLTYATFPGPETVRERRRLLEALVGEAGVVLEWSTDHVAGHRILEVEALEALRQGLEDQGLAPVLRTSPPASTGWWDQIFNPRGSRGQSVLRVALEAGGKDWRPWVDDDLALGMRFLVLRPGHGAAAALDKLEARGLADSWAVEDLECMVFDAPWLFSMGIYDRDRSKADLEALVARA